MDNTQKPSSPPTFDPMSPPTYPPAPTFPQEPPPPFPPTAPSFNPPPPVAPLWPPAPEPAPISPPPSTFPASPLPSPTPDLSSGWPPATPPPPNTSSTSPLDNPWGAPFQPPPISTPSTPPPWTPPQTPIETSDSPPTDLSHLVGNNPQPEPAPANLNQAETLVVPPAVVPESAAEPLENGKRGIPKWLIGVGVGLLLAVLGTSAYFIMRIGQTPKTTSLPAVDTSQTTQIKPPAPIATPVSQQSAPATGSASFGEIQGGGQQQATRAGDLLRQGR